MQRSRSLLLSNTCAFQPEKVRRSRHETILHHYLNWGAISAHAVERTGLQRQETRIAAQNHLFLLNLHGYARSGEDYVDGRRVEFRPRGPGSVVFLPADSEWRGWDEGDPKGSYLLVSMDSDFVRDTVGAAPLNKLPPRIGFRDPTNETSLQRIATELKNPEPTSAIMVQSQAVQMLVQMIRLSGQPSRPVKGGLSPVELKRICRFMDANLSMPPTAEELAMEINLSRRHFFRAFKQSTGKTPFAYIAAQRLKRAMELLRTTDGSSTEIALECGYSSASHFAHAFKRVHGIGPLEYRRKWRSR